MFAIIDLFLGAKTIKKSQMKKKKSFDIIIIKFSCYYCSIDLKRQSEHSKFRPDTSSLVFFLKLLRREIFRSVFDHRNEKLHPRFEKLFRNLEESSSDNFLFFDFYEFFNDFEGLFGENFRERF